MAKLNTARAELVAQLFDPRTGKTRAVRSDGVLLARSIFDGKWRRIATIKGKTVAEYLAYRRNGGWIDFKRGCVPSFAEIERMEYEGTTEATDGCTGIEPDGHCEHGCPSWVLAALGGY